MVVAHVCLFVFFFFKQKTAYEMRISNWSSDVCSSDLNPDRPHVGVALAVGEEQGRYSRIGKKRQDTDGPHHLGGRDLEHKRVVEGRARDIEADRTEGRSEEHTSELQSLMRNSYAVFCLKKKKLSRPDTMTNTAPKQ